MSNEEIINWLNICGVAFKSCQMHYKKGHNDTCSHALNDIYECDCGYELAKEVIEYD